MDSQRSSAFAVAGVAVEARLERGGGSAQRIPAPTAVIDDRLLHEVQLAERLAADLVGNLEPQLAVARGIAHAELGDRLVNGDAHGIEVAAEVGGAPCPEVRGLVVDWRLAALAYARTRARGMATNRFFKNLRMNTTHACARGGLFITPPLFITFFIACFSVATG